MMVLPVLCRHGNGCRKSRNWEQMDLCGHRGPSVDGFKSSPWSISLKLFTQAHNISRNGVGTEREKEISVLVHGGSCSSFL